MEHIKEYSQGEFVVAGIIRNVFGEYVTFVGTTIRNFATLAEAETMCADYLSLINETEMKEAA